MTTPRPQEPDQDEGSPPADTPKGNGANTVEEKARVRVACPRCNKRLQVPPANLKGRTVPVQCPSCQHQFHIRGKPAAETPAEQTLPPDEAEEPSAPPPVESPATAASQDQTVDAPARTDQVPSAAGEDQSPPPAAVKPVPHAKGAARSTRDQAPPPVSKSDEPARVVGGRTVSAPRRSRPWIHTGLLLGIQTGLLVVVFLLLRGAVQDQGKAIKDLQNKTGPDEAVLAAKVGQSLQSALKDFTSAEAAKLQQAADKAAEALKGRLQKLDNLELEKLKTRLARLDQLPDRLPKLDGLADLATQLNRLQLAPQLKLLNAKDVASLIQQLARLKAKELAALRRLIVRAAGLEKPQVAEVEDCDILVLAVNSKNLYISPDYVNVFKTYFTNLALRRSSNHRVGFAVVVGKSLNVLISLKDGKVDPARLLVSSPDGYIAEQLDAVGPKLIQEFGGLKEFRNSQRSHRCLIVASAKCPVPSEEHKDGESWKKLTAVDVILIAHGVKSARKPARDGEESLKTVPKNLRDWMAFCARKKGVLVYLESESSATKPAPEVLNDLRYHLRRLTNPLPKVR